MPLDSEIVVVSGLPRSGTSLMMQLLHAGGVPIMADHLRTADVDNPRGYHEFEKAKQIEHDTSWLPEARGKAFKMVSQLLYHLPGSERYRIIFMQRRLDEILVSQEKMLQRLQVAAAPREQIKNAYEVHLDKLFGWLGCQPNMVLLMVSYNLLVADPPRHAAEVNTFLGGEWNAGSMAHAVAPELYRNRRGGTEEPQRHPNSEKAPQPDDSPRG